MIGYCSAIALSIPSNRLFIYSFVHLFICPFVHLLPSSCESGPRAGYGGFQRRRGSKVRMAVDTLGHLLAVHVTPADEQARAQVRTLYEQVQYRLPATGHTVELAWADQGFTGGQAAPGRSGQRD